ncbi:MAG: siphovirus Gp157 family protein [Veillonellaceae bacterium]|nr:siphovirus Gp157 family protein [Veillonellaceae bacterium]
MEETLYQHGLQYIELRELAEREEIDPQVLQDTFAAIEESAAVKVDNIGKLYRQLDADEEAVQKEIERLAERKKHMERTQERLKDIVKAYLELVGQRKVAGALFTATIKRNTPKVIINDEAAIPREFIKVKTTESVDKTAIKKAIAAGAEVAGATVIQEERLELK